MEADELYIEPAGDDDEDEYEYSISPTQPSSHGDLYDSNQRWNHLGHLSTETTRLISSDYLDMINTTMSITTEAVEFDSLNVEPYIHLNGFLPNLTKNEGELLRLRCNVAGTLPIDFRWYKNDAPLLKEKDRIVVKNSDYGSRLIVRPLEPLDQAFYRCEASNKAGKASTTALIQVKPNKNRHIGSTSMGANRKNEDRSDREDDFSSLTPFTCQEYPFDACRRFLDGQKIYIHSKNLEDLRDIDRRLRAAFIVINNSSQVSSDCKEYAARAACYHSYSICDTSSSLSHSYFSGHLRNPVSRTASNKETPQIQRICKRDCEQLEKDICPEEYKTARSQNLIGKAKDQILPNCADLSDDVERCLPILTNSLETSAVPCYVGNGESYRGLVATTKSGRRCRKWSEASKKSPFTFTAKTAELKFHNYCRNPGGTKAGPWCFTADGVEEYCDVPMCAPGSYRHSDKENVNGGSDIQSNSNIMGIPSAYANYVLVGGVFGILFMAIFAILACYCVKKSKRNKDTKLKQLNGVMTPPVANGASTTLLPQSIANGHTHHYLHQRDNYGGGLFGNGTKKPILNGQQLEMASLLPSAPPVPPFYVASISQQHASSILDTLPEIPAKNIRLIEELGQGQFAKVWMAELVRMNSADDGEEGDNDSIQVAVKTVKEDASPRVWQDFEHEASTVARFKHPNVIQLIGVACMRAGSSSTPPNLSGNTPIMHPVRPCMVFEYMMHGDLNNFLLLRSPYSQREPVDKERILLDHSDFLHIATQIVSGMEYLSSQHYIHRDLATRNCLVADRLTIKISDFGLMRDVYASDYYRQQSSTPLPIRWMPPEAIMYGRYSEASDVWAYGVTLWEIYSYGTQPYYGCSNPEVADMIRQRYLLPCPDNCPSRMYSLMIECWHETPARRPSFSEIYNRLENWSIVSSPAHSSAIQAIGCVSNNRMVAPCRVTSSSVHSDRSIGNSSAASSSKTRSNVGPIGSDGQVMSTNSIIALGSIPPAGTPTSRNSPYSTANKNSPQLSRTPLAMNGYALRGITTKPYASVGATATDTS